MKRRILFVTNTTVYGGTEKHVVDLIRRLDGWNVDSTVLCYGSDVYSRYFGNRPNVRIVSQGLVKSDHLLSYWLTFMKFKPHTYRFHKDSLISKYSPDEVSEKVRLVKELNSTPLLSSISQQSPLSLLQQSGPCPIVQATPIA